MLFIIVALPCEAKPLIELFKLKFIPDRVFPVYANSSIQLIVSGVGKINAALAVGYLGTKSKEGDIWINIGVAGHSSLGIGKGVFAHKVIDGSTQKAYYPTFLSLKNKATHIIYTVDHPEKEFFRDCFYDMEASGFIEAALKFSSSNFVHCYKVVSDNKGSLQKLSPNWVEDLIRGHLGSIKEFIDELLDLSQEIEEPLVSLGDFLIKWHFTETQKYQLQRLLQRCLSLNREVFVEEFEGLKVSQLLCELGKKIDSLPLSFSCSQ